ncbi:hypothetical protein [Gilvimarinus sp. 1_MG-2023]|uniref:hypothetical protein n=1 Tax=Gilvimarinus sp. 1_MG-2023 TaxID=3062638 RepID=UPI0026E3199B|nr:hypothetical protein [Gilvimarinus sp. 1_MG-2023]MDO6745864.1 hypothetical protein [Gilvimarinus sp. 1_MG-2023]
MVKLQPLINTDPLLKLLGWAGTTLLLLMVLTTLNISTAEADEKIPAISGFAYTMSDNSDTQAPWLYREDYYFLTDNQVQVFYTNHSEQLIAEKVLDYATGRLTPSFIFEDQRHQISKRVEVNASNVELYLKSGPQSERATLERKKNQVVDAGFTAVVRNNWSALQAGQSIDFFFALPNRATNARLAARQIKCPARMQANHCFEMALSNRFLAMFVDSITLGFDQQQRLTEYRGRSNLSDSAGGDQDVIIRYRYADPEQRL